MWASQGSSRMKHFSANLRALYFSQIGRVWLSEEDIMIRMESMALELIRGYKLYLERRQGANVRDLCEFLMKWYLDSHW